MSDTQTQRYCKVLKKRGHWKPQIWTYYILFLFSVMVVEASNEWPTYQHPTSSSQECYMCPPGFYKIRDCAPTRDKSVQWSMCLPCPDSQYSQRWNTDGRCWDRDFCEKEHVVVYDGGNIGPIKCACNGSSLEDENGVCVAGITSSKHRDVLNQLRVSCDAKVKAAKEVIMVTPVRSTTTQSPCTMRSTTTQSPCTTAEATEASCPECPEWAVCEGHSESEPTQSGILIAIGCVGWLLAILFLILYVKERKRDAKQSNGFTSVPNGHVPAPGGQPSPSTQNQVHSLSILSPTQPSHVGIEERNSETTADGRESVSSRQDLDSKDSDSKDSDSKDSDADDGRIPNGTPKTPTHVLITPIEPQEGKKESRPNNRNDEVSKTGGISVVFVNEGKEKEDQATPAVGEEQERRQNLLDDALRIMEREVTTRDEAYRIIRHVLGLSANQCRSILDKEKTSDGVLREGFRIWEESKGSKEANVENLVLGLLKHQNRLMAEKINAELKLNLKLDREDNEIDEFDDVIKICEEILVVDDRVVEFFRSYLELGGKVTKADRKTLIRKGLQKWQAKNGKSATAEKLIELFISAGMQNEADGICKELKCRDLGAVGGNSTFEPVENVSKAVPIRGATGADGYSELSASDSRPRSSRSSDTQGTSYSTSSPGRRSLDNGRSSREVLRNSRVDSSRTFPSQALSSQESRVGNPTADVDVEHGTRHESPSTSFESGSLQRREDLVSECERVKDADNSRPIEHVDLEDECSGHGGKEALLDDTQYYEKDETKALKPGKDKPKELKSNIKPKEIDPLLENHENKKRRKKKKSRSMEA